MLFGVLLGYLTMSVKRIGIFCLGFWLGTALAFLLNNAILHKIGVFFTLLSMFFLQLTLKLRKIMLFGFP